MSTTTNFRVTIIGDESKLREFKETVLKAIDNTCGDDGDFILHIDRLFSDVDGEREHTCVGIDDVRHRGEPIIGPMLDSAETGMHRLFFRGVSIWTLPIKLMVRLSRMFPELEFRFGGTTECEVRTDWIATNGNVTMSRLVIHLHPNQLSVFLARDGKLLDVPEIMDNSYEWDYGNKEGPLPIIPDDLEELCLTIYREFLGRECPGSESGQLRKSILTLLQSRAKRFKTQPAIDWDEEPSEQVRQMAEEIAARKQAAFGRVLYKTMVNLYPPALLRTMASYFPVPMEENDA